MLKIWHIQEKKCLSVLSLRNTSTNHLGRFNTDTNHIFISCNSLEPGVLNVKRCKKFILRLNQDKNFKLFGKLLQTEYIKNIYNYKVEIYKFEENPHENICKKYDLKYKLVHELNRNRNKKIKDYYDNELIYIVNNIFEDDFTYLNYKMVPNISELNF